jgi:hypothetical protein
MRGGCDLLIQGFVDLTRKDFESSACNKNEDIDQFGEGVHRALLEIASPLLE